MRLSYIKNGVKHTLKSWTREGMRKRLKSLGMDMCMIIVDEFQMIFVLNSYKDLNVNDTLEHIINYGSACVAMDNNRDDRVWIKRG